METKDKGPSLSPAQAPERIDSWKGIAEYLGRAVRTVHRWEQEESLPVHRHSHNKASSVYAIKSELDSWLVQRAPEDAKTVEPCSLAPAEIKVMQGRQLNWSALSPNMVAFCLLFIYLYLKFKLGHYHIALSLR